MITFRAATVPPEWSDRIIRNVWDGWTKAVSSRVQIAALGADFP